MKGFISYASQMRCWDLVKSLQPALPWAVITQARDFSCLLVPSAES